MKEQWVKIKEWWSTLASREKRAISVGGPCAALFILYQCIWSPFIDAVAGMRGRIESQQKVLAWMQAADTEIVSMGGNALQSKAVKTSTLILLSILQKQITQTGLAQSLAQLKQAGNDAISLQFKKVDFDKMITLLIATLREQNVTLTQMSVTADNTPGVVNASLMLKITN